MIVLETSRLILRTFEDADLEPMLAINQDEQVMRFFPSLVDQQGTKAFIAHIQQHYSQHGYCLYATELKSDGTFIGFVGLNQPSFEIPNFKPLAQPIVEIGWRLSSAHWGQGYAPEAAAKVLAYAFDEIKLKEVISFTAKINTPSVRVMQKIGLHNDAHDNFAHPKLDSSSPLSEHVLYRLANSQHLG